MLSRDVCPGVIPCLFPSLPEWLQLFFPRSFDHVTWRRSFFFPASTFFPRRLVKHLRALNFPPFLEISRPVRSSSGFMSRVGARLAVFLKFPAFRFRVPLMSYPARNGSRFLVVFLISRVDFIFFIARARFFSLFSY